MPNKNRRLPVSTRLTTTEALRQLAQQRLAVEQLPSASMMSEGLNRVGVRLRHGAQPNPQKTSRDRQGLHPIVQLNQKGRSQRGIYGGV